MTSPRRKRLRLPLAGALLLSACAWEPLPQVEVVPLPVQPVAWNLAKQDVGQVAAVIELYDDTVVFGDQGAQIFTGGLVLATDTTTKQWRAAAVIPAGDLAGQWLVAVDGAGRLLRLRNRRSFEDVSDRYGLVGSPVSAVALLSAEKAGFVVASELAVADGMTVTRYPAALTGLAGGGGRAAGLVDGAVRVVELGTTGSGTADGAGPLVHDFPLPAAVAVAFDAQAKLVAATRSGLYAENSSGRLDQIYSSPDAPIHGLATAGTALWVAVGDTLAQLTGAELRQSPGGTIASNAQLVGSPSGDVWVLQAGQLQRFGVEPSGGADQLLWQKTVLPTFTRLCSLCHLPGGSSGIDLSTYPAWASRRALINQRVILGKPSPMPPAGAGQLTADEQTALKAWVADQ